MTIQQFLDKYKHKGWYLNALSNTITLEVNCKARNEYITDKEASTLYEMGFINVLSSTDATTMTCGYASFAKYTMSREEKIEYLIQHSPAAEPPEFFKSWTMADIDAAISAHDKAESLGAGGQQARYSDALKSAIAQLLHDHPEFEEEHTTGWDMMEALKDLWNTMG